MWVVGFILFQTFIWTSAEDGPQLRFSKEPPNKVSFANSTGATIKCAAEGIPQPRISWTLVDGTTAAVIPGVREITSEGNLKFNPFGADAYRPDVHFAIYRCIATSSVGTIRSRDVNVHGVIEQSYVAQVYDVFAIDGNSAVLRCHLPVIITDYVKVIGWIKNDELLIQPAAQETNGKYALLPNGDLHVKNVNRSESAGSYKCKTKNLLTGETRVNPAGGQLFVIESQGSVPPKIIQNVPSVEAYLGEKVVLPCIVQGNPLPSSKWLRKNKTGNLVPVNFENNVILSNGSLIINNIGTPDAGTYVCEASNENGKDFTEVSVMVAERLMASVAPALQISKIGEPVTFTCEGNSTGATSIYWLHNGSPIPEQAENRLVLKSVEVSDQGMYQCLLKSDGDMIQASAQLRLSEITPYFEQTFEEITRKPEELFSASCTASGIPLPKITWTFEDVLLDNSTRITITSTIDNAGKAVGTLKITNLAVDDGGLYGCVATNKGGETRFSTRINVIGNLMARNSVKQVAVAGGNVYLNCPVFGYPIETITWSRGTSKILPLNLRYETFENGTLWIKNVQRHSDGGMYHCKAKNSLKQEVSSGVEIQVIVPPKLVPFQFQDELLREGMRARLQCVVSEGELPLNVTWLKDGQALSPDLRVLVKVLDEFSSILTINNIMPAHNGKYTCVATNRAATVTHFAELFVNVPPKIVPFSFQDENLVEGLLARVSCVVSRGDLPLKFHWEKNDVRIVPGVEGVLVRSFDEHSSILDITEVNSNHNGLYTCIASNDAGSVRHSAQLVVKVPPKWVIEPRDSSVVNGGTVFMDCQSDGYPKPVIKWMFSKDFKTLDSELNTLHDSTDLKIAENGSLVISKVSKAHEGYYLCRATNGIGIPLDAAVQVKIHAPPYFKQPLNMIRSNLGKNVQWKCDIDGDAPMIVTWYKENKELMVDNQRIIVQTINQSNTVSSTLTIHKIAREDNGSYKCVAKNKYGANSTHSSLIILESPDAPSDVKIVSQASNAVELSWSLKYNGNDAIKKYIIQYKKDTDSWDNGVTMETVNGEPTNSIVAHLQPDTSYLFRLFAENAQGRSRSSQILYAKTSEDVPSGVPLDVRVETVNAETFKITWKMPERRLWNGKILGFYIGYKELDAEDSYRLKTLLTPDPNELNLSIQISGLMQFKKYAIMVQAYNSKGKGPQSEPVQAMTSEGVPSQAPADVRCTTLSSQSIHVTWTAPPSVSINGILTGYKLAIKSTADWFDTVTEAVSMASPASSSMTLQQLKKFTDYSIEVLAVTKTGDGPRSTPVFCKTLDDVPESLAHVKVVPSSQDSIVVSWKPLENPSGIIRSYKLYWKGVNESKEPSVQTFSSDTKNFKVPQLLKDQQYEFWMTASTSAGEGTPSKVFLQSPAGPKVPAKITSFDDKVVETRKSRVRLPCATVGIPAPKIKWTIKGTTFESNDKFTILPDGSLVIEEVLEEDAGSYICSAQNELSTDSISYVLHVLAPPLAPSLELLMLTSSSIEIQWRNPSKTSRITGYVVHMKREIEDEWTKISIESDQTTYKLGGLYCGTKYEVVIFAVNRIGHSPPSEPLIVTTNGSVPAPPTKFDLIEEASNSVSLYLNTWKSNGCPIMYFVIEYSHRSSNEWSLVSNNVKPERRLMVLSDLKSGTWYGLRITAHNSAGSNVAEYDFATLTFAGVTISPDIQSDAASEEVEGAMVYLNLYLIVPIACTLIVLVAIAAASCFYVKMMKPRHTNDMDNSATTSGSTLKPGDRSGSFSYMQRGTLNRAVDHSRLTDDELTPYATFQLSNHPFGTLGRNGNGAATPPLPPPRFEGFTNNTMSTNSRYTPSGNGFMPGHGPVETTFIFPHLHADDGSPHGSGTYPRGYPSEDVTMRFN